MGGRREMRSVSWEWSSSLYSEVSELLGDVEGGRVSRHDRSAEHWVCREPYEAGDSLSTLDGQRGEGREAN